MKKNRKLIGEVGVDSGSIMIVDPCYLDKFENNEFNYSTGIEKDGKRYEFRVHFENWESPIEEEGGKTANQLSEEGWKSFKEYPDAGRFSYSGAAGITCGKESAGQLYMNMGSHDYPCAVASSSGYGDGGYPVYAEFNEEGRVKSLTIQFID